ncbi:Uu.00g087980.m01.CDS01 [Anthostomella pinea]|uniref:Uu.00g087980.m01.CDS01 n=1 Tax=Anthostomella pinea TaxID=933095 RepID=A0AAI8VN24_9PEZI|nr:Uu.00g087980.m01.CDS01 [Anthostomella pinea]
MARENTHHSSKAQRGHRHKPKQREERLKDSPKKPDVAAKGDINEKARTATSAWSNSVPDPESGRFNYQARQTPDGRWQWTISGLSSGTHSQYFDLGTSMPMVYTKVGTTTPCIADNSAEYPLQSQQPYQQPNQISPQDSGSTLQSAIAPHVEIAKPAIKLPIPAEGKVGQTAAAAEKKHAAKKNGPETTGRRQDERRHERRHGSHSGKHRRDRDPGHVHGKKEHAGRKKHDRVDAKGKVSQWLHQPSYDDQ